MNAIKKVFSFSLVAILLLSFFVLPVSAVVPFDISDSLYSSGMPDDEKITTDDGFVYFVNDDGSATICGVPEGVKNVLIPSKVDGYTVKAINSHCQRFSGGEDVDSLTVPDSVIYIGGYSMRAFNNATEINLPSSLIQIDDLAFFHDTAYYKNPDNWDNGCLYIGTNLVSMNENVPETLVLREDTTCIAKRPVYSYSPSMKHVILPDHYINGLNNLPLGSSVESAVIPGDLEVIPDYMFSGCSGLADLSIGSGIKTIGTAAFRGCSTLDEITIPNSVTTIKEDAFVNCENLKQIYIPASVSSIEEHALGYERYTYHDYIFSGEWITKYRLYLDFSICGVIGSAAHEYAQQNNIPFIATADENTPSVSSVDEACFGKLGDTDTNRKINIKDATAIQKHLANIQLLSENGLALADVNADGKLSVQDATSIRKYIAGIEIDDPVGETTDLRLFVHVYGKKGMEWNWTGDYDFCFFYYKEEFGDMIEYPGVVAEYDAIAGGWGAYIPVEANHIRFSFAEFHTIDMPMPSNDAMIGVPGESVGVYLYDCIWQEIK